MEATRVQRMWAAASAAFTAASLGLAGAPHASASTALVVGGTTFPTMSEELMAGLANTFADVRVNVPYPAQLWPWNGQMQLGDSVAAGTAALLEMITTAAAVAGQITVWGISQGALVLSAAQAALLEHPAAPASSAVTFVRVADPSTPGAGLLSHLPKLLLDRLLDFDPSHRLVTESQYNTIVIAAEFDGFADFPDRPWNVLATVNALVGLWYRHGQTATMDLAAVPAQNISTTVNRFGATTTSYLVPAPALPLTEALRDVGIPARVVDALEPVIRPIVEAGYSRYDRPPDEPATAQGPVEPAATASVTESVAVPAPVVAEPGRRLAHRVPASRLESASPQADKPSRGTRTGAREAVRGVVRHR
jgi:hypothetical protein